MNTVHGVMSIRRFLRLARLVLKKLRRRNTIFVSRNKRGEHDDDLSKSVIAIECVSRILTNRVVFTPEKRLQFVLEELQDVLETVENLD